MYFVYIKLMIKVHCYKHPTAMLAIEVSDDKVALLAVFMKKFLFFPVNVFFWDSCYPYTHARAA